MSKLVPINIPIRGLNTVNPFIEFDSGYARELTNYLLLDGRLGIRPAVKSYKYNSLNETLGWYDAAADRGIEKNTGDVIEVSTNTLIGSVGAQGGPYNPTIVRHMDIEFVFGINGPRLANSPFTAWTFTPITIVATEITCGCSHKGRLYVASGSEINYSNTEQVTGNMLAYLDYAQYLDDQEIFRMFSVTVQPGNQTENVLVIFGSGGKVLVFSGTYPDSDSWQLIGDFNMPSPIQGGFVEIDGDIFVTTARYAYWFRDLFSGGAQTAYENSPTRPIENIWQFQYWSSGNLAGYVGFDNTNFFPEHAHSFYLDTVGSTNVDIIVCQVQQKNTTVAEYLNEALSFVYHRKYKAWSLWLGTPFFAPIRYQGTAYYGTGYDGEIVTLNDDDFVDESHQGGIFTQFDIETSWKTPYVSPFSGRNQKLSGVRTFWENTSSGYFHKMRAIFDYSDYNAPYGFYTQSTVTQINPGKYSDGQFDLAANTWNHYNEFKTLGGLGAGFSLQFTLQRKSGSNAEQHQQIYAASALVTDGGAIF